MLLDNVFAINEASFYANARVSLSVRCGSLDDFSSSRSTVVCWSCPFSFDKCRRTVKLLHSNCARFCFFHFRQCERKNAVVHFRYDFTLIDTA